MFLVYLTEYQKGKSECLIFNAFYWRNEKKVNELATRKKKNNNNGNNWKKFG